MAGAKEGEFKELISSFLTTKIEEARARGGETSQDYLALVRQYVKHPLESVILPSERRRHYESEVKTLFEGKEVIGVERLYRHTILIEPTTICAAHCRWCLRGQYPIKTMNPAEIVHAARYIGSEALRDEVREVLVTGGDPLTSVLRLRQTIESLKAHAPNIKIIRIGTRVPFHNPHLVSDAMLEMFASFPQYVFEIGVNVNHPVEFWPESVAVIKKLQKIGVRFYNQHPLLKGVNDDLDTLRRLYTLLRENLIEAHYLFHAIPMRGMRHHRTSLKKGLGLATALNSCGEFSGRAKPKYAILSDIGKIVLFHDSILERNEKDGTVLIRSGYKLQDRLRWNPSWVKPQSVVVEKDGTMLTWYTDGTDVPLEDLR